VYSIVGLLFLIASKGKTRRKTTTTTTGVSMTSWLNLFYILLTNRFIMLHRP